MIRRISIFLLVVFGYVAIVAAGEPAPANSGTDKDANAAAENKGSAPAEAAAKPNPEDEMRAKMEQLLSKMSRAIARLKGYTCTFTKQEFVDGELLPTETIFMKHRRKGNCIYMKWIKEPHKNRESLWCPAKYGKKVKAHEGGFFGFVTVSLDPKGSMAMKGNRHPITEAGLYHTFKLIKNDFELGKKHPEHHVKYEKFWEQKVKGQPSWCVSVVQPKDKKLGYYAHKAVICMHKKLYLPTLVKIWDHKGRLVEVYTYSNYKINPSLTDKDFDVDNSEYNF